MQNFDINFIKYDDFFYKFPLLYRFYKANTKSMYDYIIYFDGYKFSNILIKDEIFFPIGEYKSTVKFFSIVFNIKTKMFYTDIFTVLDFGDKLNMDLNTLYHEYF